MFYIFYQNLLNKFLILSITVEREITFIVQRLAYSFFITISDFPCTTCKNVLPVNTYLKKEYNLFVPPQLLQGCVAIISMTWIMSVTVFSILVLPRGGYYFNSTGMMACEPFYSKPSVRILAACGFYFPTTMILMYCYGSAFHVNKLRLRRRSECNTVSSPEEEAGIERVRYENCTLFRCHDSSLSHVQIVNQFVRSVRF